MSTAPTIIPIVKEDRETFLAFKKHREKFLVFLEAGVFDLDHGQVNINMHNGQVQQIYVNRMTYKRDAKEKAPTAGPQALSA